VNRKNVVERGCAQIYTPSSHLSDDNYRTHEPEQSMFQLKQKTGMSQTQVRIIKP